MSGVHNLEHPQIVGGSLPNSGHVSAEDTNGLYSLVEIVSSAGDAAPMHVHQIENEHVFVIEGTARIPGGCEEACG
jgi:uncharacterized cupin superfamily protein